MPHSSLKLNNKMKKSIEILRINLIEHYTNILKTIVYLNSVSQSNGIIVESITSLNNEIIKNSIDTASNRENIEKDEITTISKDQDTDHSNVNNNQQNIIAVMNYLKFTGFIDYYIDNMKKDKITITISPVISAFLLQYYFEIGNILDSASHSHIVLKDPKHKDDERILLLQKLFVTSSLSTTGAGGANQSASIEY